jgi:hypothetical protein
MHVKVLSTEVCLFVLKQGKLLIIAVFLLTGYLAPGIVNAQLMQMERIYHIPETKITSGLPLLLEGRIENGINPPVAAQVFYRTQGEGAYSFIDLSVDEWQLSATIPASEVNSPGIEYYFQADLPSGIILTFPAGAPSNREPFRVDVVQMGAATGSTGQVVTIINPNRGETIKGEEVVIAIALNQHFRELDPKNLRLELNGVNITKYAVISKELVSFVSNRIRNGKHRVALYEIKSGVKELLVEWTFKSEGVTRGAVNKNKNIEGSVSVKFNQEEISLRRRDVALLDGRISGEYKGLDLSGKLYLTSLEDKNLQSQNRYLGVIRHKKLTLKLGDTQPRFSQFTMWGSRNRGVELNFYSSSINFSFAVGSLLRAIEGISKTVIDTTYEFNNLGDTTDVVIDTSVVTDISGSYNRMLFALRSSFPVSRHGFISFNFLKAKDQMNSIDWGSKPKDNLVFGADIELEFLDRLIKFTSETAISLYNSDISPGPLAQAESIKDIIVVNQFFEPLPSDSAIFDETIGTGELAFSVLKELFKSSMAHQTGLGLNLKRNQVNLSYKTVGQSFHSLGSSAIQTDIHGFSISDRIRLFKNRVYLNLGYDDYSDNVNERSPNTMNRNTVSGGFSVYTPSKYPNFSFNSRLYNRNKDAEIVYVILPDGTTDSTGYFIDDQTSSFDVSMDQDFQFKGFDHNAVLAINRSQSSDKFNEESASDVMSITLRLSSQRERKLETNVSLSHTDQNSNNGQNKINYNVASTRARYLINQLYKVWISGGINATIADGGYNPALDDTFTVAGYKIDFVRFEFSLGVEVKPNLKHSVGLSFYKVNNTDNGSLTLYQWVDVNGSWQSSTTKNTDQVNYAEQDDFAVKLRYTYTF